MASIKPRGRYMAVSVPIELHKEITDHVKKTSYNSIAEFVKDAVREKIKLDNYRNDKQKLRVIMKKDIKNQHIKTPEKWLDYAKENEDRYLQNAEEIIAGKKDESQDTQVSLITEIVIKTLQAKGLIKKE